jgi:hypothetical protein
MEVAVASASGLEIGDKDHGRMFAAEMTPYFHEALKQELQQQIKEPLSGTGRPTPVSVIADKYAPNRRTLDVVGANG